MGTDIDRLADRNLSKHRVGNHMQKVWNFPTLFQKIVGFKTMNPVGRQQQERQL